MGSHMACDKVVVATGGSCDDTADVFDPFENPDTMDPSESASSYCDSESPGGRPV